MKGGSATYFGTLVELLKDRVDFTVITLKGPRGPQNGVRVIRSLPDERSSNRFVRYLKVLPKTLQELRSERKRGKFILHAHSNGIYGLSASIYSGLSSTPLVKEVQDTSDPAWVLRAGKVVRWITTGNYLRGKLISSGIPENRLIAIPAVNPPEVNRMAQDLKARKKNGDGTFRAVFVGWLVNRIKGVDLLIEGFSKALRERSDMELVIIGDGPDRQGLEARAKGLPVKFTGELDYPRVLEWLHRSDVVVIPSHEEAEPRSIIEAYAVGTPAIGTNVGGVSEMIRDGVSGLVIEPGDPEQIAHALIMMHDLGKKREEMAAEGMKYIEQLPSWERIAKTILELYISIWEDYGRT
jgi:glycosyltransferase involved in cell wall biosynthesis